MSLAFMLIVGRAAAGTPPDVAASAHDPVTAAAEARDDSTYPSPSSTRKPSNAADVGCEAQDARDIVVCAQRRQGYRLDPSVIDADRQAERNSRSATAPMPAAQANCSASPTGCGTGLEGLDLANVAFVIGTAAIKAAKGQDWTKPFKPGGPDEYQLYLQAKRQREAREKEAHAKAVALKARQNK